MARVEIILDGSTYCYELEKDGSTILDKALDEGLDAPYSCKSGVCATCRARLEKGRVKMDENLALEEKEVSDGYVLTCQSHPVTDNVVVNYDAS